MKKEKQKLIGAIHLIALLGSKKYQICEKEKAEYFTNVKFWDKDDAELRGDFQVFINPLIPYMRRDKEISELLHSLNLKELDFKYNIKGRASRPRVSRGGDKRLHSKPLTAPML